MARMPPAHLATVATQPLTTTVPPVAVASTQIQITPVLAVSQSVCLVCQIALPIGRLVFQAERLQAATPSSSCLHDIDHIHVAVMVQIILLVPPWITSLLAPSISDGLHILDPHSWRRNEIT